MIVALVPVRPETFLRFGVNSLCASSRRTVISRKAAKNAKRINDLCGFAPLREIPPCEMLLYLDAGTAAYLFILAWRSRRRETLTRVRGKSAPVACAGCPRRAVARLVPERPTRSLSEVV